jgi:hypothetical protein
MKIFLTVPVPYYFCLMIEGDGSAILLKYPKSLFVFQIPEDDPDYYSTVHEPHT